MSLEGVQNAVTNFLRGGVSRLDYRDSEREFLPAALEVLETPPSPAGRTMAMVIGLFFVTAVAWAFLGKVDVLATAPGVLLPSGRIKLIQPLDPGVIRVIHAQDGDHVRAGQLLIELDGTAPGADRNRLAQDLAQTELEVARLTALKPMAETGRSPGPLVVPAGASPDDVEQARGALRAQIEEQGAKAAGLDQQISEKRAEQEEVAATTAKLKASLPMMEEKERLHRTLREQGYGTSFALIDAQQQLSEAKRDLVVEAARADQTRAATAALERARSQASSEFAAGVLADLAKAQEKQNELKQELIKAQQKSAATQMRSPIDGVVEELAVHTVGGVVTAAQRLMIVVPDNERLTVEAQLANRDIGFVHPGQDVQVKVETFNFTRYGLIHGTVVDVSRDVVSATDRQTDQSGASAGATEPGGSPAYVARISLDRSVMTIDGEQKRLMPGMAVTAEIRTGRRTIIDYLLSPLARKGDEALHER